MLHETEYKTHRRQNHTRKQKSNSKIAFIENHHHNNYLQTQTKRQLHSNPNVKNPKASNPDKKMHRQSKRENRYPFLAKEVTDLNTLVTISNASIDGKVSVNHPHLVPVPLGNPSDEILNMTNSGANSSSGLPGAKPRVDLEPALAIGLSDELKIKVKVFEVAGELSTRTLNFYHLSIHFNGDPFWDLH